MKREFNSKHFKFTVQHRRFKSTVWNKYYSLKKKEKLDEPDKQWMKQFREELKIKRSKLVGKHLPSKTEQSWDLDDKKPEYKKYIAELKTIIQKNRVSAKKSVVTPKEFGGALYHLTGGVFPQAGIIKDLGPKLTINDPLKPKKPRLPNKNYLGIELEFNRVDGIDRNRIASRLREAGLARYVDVGEDPSCGWEVRVLVTEDELDSVLPKIMSIIKDLGHNADYRCGTHVHIDMRRRDIKTVYENLFKAQKFLRKFIPTKRKTNSYCVANKHASYETHQQDGGRYYAFNTQSYGKHKTLEVRLHHGTLDPKEIVSWIKLLLKIVNYTNPLEVPINTMRQARQVLAIDDILSKDLEEKMIKASGRVRTILGLGA